MRAIRLFIAEEEGRGTRLLLFRKGVWDRLELAKRRRLRLAISHLNRFPLSSGRRILLSNCASRGIWPARVARRGHWSHA
jgi:hypothetical protein